MIIDLQLNHPLHRFDCLGMVNRDSWKIRNIQELHILYGESIVNDLGL
jgi:hypothetical protein